MALDRLTPFDPNVKDSVQYNVEVPDSKNFSKHHGYDVMHRDYWLGSVECGCFIDYDGYGDMLDKDLTKIGRIHPSAAGKAPKEFEWIIWYNR